MQRLSGWARGVDGIRKMSRSVGKSFATSSGYFFSNFGGGTGIFNYGRLMAALFSNVEVH